MTRPTTAQLNAAYDQFNFWYDKAKKLDEELAKAEERIAELEESNAQVIQSRDHYKRMTEEGLKQLAESRAVKLPRKNIGWDRDEDDCWNNAIDACAESLTAAGIKWESA